ncbi:RNA polymerase subunit sigma [Paracoccus sp. MBLB3053]|uniref:RNA polymerase subunit sigma n=1 Tax=Paracoccus aurantius TaxID=3073814 RepID=A0ABU2HM94_9RHOB|nr:RNA polymerase subunit sigma [Paracoccus sp. MBLB3053]MDS9466158.1 RNA polymerase subunit sigma [Paracoccus sp. MBLB3053]
MPEARRIAIDDMIAKTAQGNREAFDALYAATSARLYALCLSILKDRPEAETTLERLYVALWQGSAGQPPQGAAALQWLTALARYRAIERLRARQAGTSSGEGARKAGALAAVPAEIEGSAAAPILSDLDEAQAEAIRDVFLNGLTYADLALRENVAVDDLRHWMRGALLRLRN